MRGQKIKEQKSKEQRMIENIKEQRMKEHIKIYHKCEE